MDVHLERQFPFLVADVVDRFEAGLMGRVVDEDIDTAKLRYGFCDDGAALTGVLYVAGKQNGLSAGFRHHPLGLPGVVMLVEIGNQNVSSFSRVGDGDGAADATIATGDNGLLAFEAAAALIERFAMVGGRVHRGCFAGHRLVSVRERRAGIMQHGSACAFFDRNTPQHPLGQFVPALGRWGRQGGLVNVDHYWLER